MKLSRNLFSIILVFVSLLLAGCSDPTPPMLSDGILDVSKIKQISLEKLAEEIEGNPLAAYEKYNGKWVILTDGRIFDILNIWIQYDISLSYGSNNAEFIDCYFSKSHKDAIMKLKKGDRLAICGLLDMNKLGMLSSYDLMYCNFVEFEDVKPRFSKNSYIIRRTNVDEYSWPSPPMTADGHMDFSQIKCVSLEKFLEDEWVEDSPLVHKKYVNQWIATAGRIHSIKDSLSKGACEVVLKVEEKGDPLVYLICEINKLQKESLLKLKQGDKIAVCGFYKSDSESVPRLVYCYCSGGAQ